VAKQCVYVGMLYIGAAIENSAFHVQMEKARAAGEPVWEMPVVASAEIAERLWAMHQARSEAEVNVPEHSSDAW